MATTKTVKPIRTLRGMELDVRGVPLLGSELNKTIIASVARSQQFVMTELPAWLIVSHRQFVSLNRYTEEMFNTRDRLFRTPLNVMEVQVDEELDHVRPHELGVSEEEAHAIAEVTALADDHI